MADEGYPAFETMCRLCLKENAANISIFISANPKETLLSIPIRIMSCAALEVQENDNLPKAICIECRDQLERSFYFRKRSQYADTKLRKHLRLISLGKKSRVFAKKNDDDDDDYELDFEDSVRFIREQDNIRAAKLKADQREELKKLKLILVEEIKKELNENLEQNVFPQLRKKIELDARKELRDEVREEVKEELRIEVEAEVREKLLPTIQEECREKELNGLLNELEGFLREKRSKNQVNIKNDVIRQEQGQILINLEALEKAQIEKKTAKRIAKSVSPEVGTAPKQLKLEEATGQASKSNDDVRETQEDTATVQYARSSSESNSCAEHDNDSSNYYIIDDNLDENDDSNETTQNAVDEIENEMHGEDEADDEDVLIVNNLNNENYQLNETDQKRTVTSYQIEESGENIQLYKRKDSLKSETDKSERDGNIVILNFEQSSVDEEHLEMVEFVNLNEKVLLMKHKDNENADKETGENQKRLSSTDSQNFQTEITENPKPVQTTRISDTPKTFKCPSCPIQFSIENSLNRHMKTHLKVAEKGVSHQCPECGIFVSCKSALTRHMIIHSGIKPYVCEECGKSFVQREILKRHKQSHTGIKPYKCKHCARLFAQKANLIQHINKNHMAVPIVGQHPCPLCPKRFNHSSGLSRHLATHNGVTFQCSECERTFSDRSSVKRHITNMHGLSIEGEPLKE